MNKNTIKVNIFGAEYPIVGQENADYIQHVAKYVDKKMKEINSAKPNRPLHQIAMLTALNIADELFQSKKNQKIILSNVENKILNMTKKLEHGINNTLMEE